MKLIANIILFIIAIVLAILFLSPSILHKIFGAVRRDNTYKELSTSFYESALAIDIACNTVFSSLFNDWCLKKNSYPFGKRGESVSSVLGKNLVLGTLTKFGLGVSGLLDLIDVNHCYKNIEGTGFEHYPEPKKIPSYITIIVTLISIGILYSLFILCSIFI